MADEPQKVIVQSSRIDASILPPGFSLPYRLYVIQQTTDIKNISDASNNANELAYQASVKNAEQDVRLDDQQSELDDHDARITQSEGDISNLKDRATASESNISTINGQVSSLFGQVNSLSSGKAEKTEVLMKSNNLSDVPDKSVARSNLSLGNSSTRDVGTTSGTVAAGNDSRFGTVDGKSGGEITSQITVDGRVTSTGFSSRRGVDGVTRGNYFNIYWTESGTAELWIDGTRIGTINITP